MKKTLELIKTVMNKTILSGAMILLFVFFVPLKSFAPTYDKITKKKMFEFFKDELLIRKNLDILKDSTYKTRKEVFHLVQPVIEIYLKRGDYHKHFPNLSDSVSYAITCIFVSESSNKMGHSARSTLWLYHNNPFGITGKTGKSLESWEMINNKRIIMNRTFRTFDSFSDAIDTLMFNFKKDSYSLTSNSSTIKDFLFNLYRNNYMTNKHWSNFAWNEIYLKSIN